MIAKRLLSGKRIPVYAGILLTFVLVLLYASLPASQRDWLQRLEYLFYDWRFDLLPVMPATSDTARIVILDIDERSIAALGRWPWSRVTMAQLFDQLADYGTAVAGLDMVLSEAEDSDLHRWLHSLTAEQRQQLPGGSQGAVLEADQALANSMNRLDVVSGFFFSAADISSTGALPEELANLEVIPPTLISFDSYTATLPLIQQAAAGSGFVSTFPDSDGSIRRTPLIARHNDDLYPSLSLALALTYLLDWRVDLETVLIADVPVPRAIRFAGLQARLDMFGQVIVPYHGPKGSYPYVSAVDVVRGQLAQPQLLEGAIVLIGTSAAGLVDLRATPVGAQFPGVEVHANVLDTLLHGSFPYRPEWEAGATLFSLLLTGLLLSLLLPGMRPLRAIGWSFGLLLVLVGCNCWLWRQGLDLPMAAPLLLALMLVVLNLGYGFVHENSDKRRLKQMFDQYVPPAHIEKMLADPDAYQFQGETREMTVLFSDIRSFTSISEGLSATELKQLLNSYFTPLSRVLFDHEATIDKYVGDMVMAFWGAPLEDRHHASHAVAAALAMQACCAGLEPEFRQRGWPVVRAGIGISTGSMNVGDMGSAYRRAYTVLGDAVNLGSRLEALCRFYGADILVSERTRQQALAFSYRFVDRIRVKGKAEVVDIYEPLGLEADISPEARQELQQHQVALAFYFSANWASARQAFEELQQATPRPLYQRYIERLLQWQQLPPANWDGSFNHSAKS
ncbi:CHASE2 domain-containing protein [Oceanobacter mangrovi]|uniref:CHASE2 domain-containing protein n=1 Tax=Oceanobacter mangrovi TaxID=2862510 RepID=UPI001C8D6726|nr:adenylate/guanylate cyclase domain-containing protein [Oceanobacter mangrovi]